MVNQVSLGLTAVGTDPTKDTEGLRGRVPVPQTGQEHTEL